MFFFCTSRHTDTMTTDIMKVFGIVSSSYYNWTNMSLYNHFVECPVDRKSAFEKFEVTVSQRTFDEM